MDSPEQDSSASASGALVEGIAENEDKEEDLTYDEDSLNESLLFIDTNSESEDYPDGSQNISNAQNISTEDSAIMKFSCKQCSVSFSWAHQLRKHRRLIHGTLKCNLCSKSVGSISSMKHHKKSKHNINFVFSCQVCNEVFITSRELMQHQKLHKSTEKQRSFKCKKKKIQTDSEIQNQKCGRRKKKWRMRSAKNALWEKKF